MQKNFLSIINGILLCLIVFLWWGRYKADKIKLPISSCETGQSEPLAVVSWATKEAVFWDIENPHKQAFFRQLKTLKLQSGKEKLIAYYGDEKLKKKKFDHLKLLPLSFEETLDYFQKQGIIPTEEQKEYFRRGIPFIYDFWEFYIASCANGQYGGAGTCLPETNKPFSFLYSYEEYEIQEHKALWGLIIQKKGEKEWFPLFQVRDQFHYGPYILRVESGVIYLAVSTPWSWSGDYVLYVYRLEEKEFEYNPENLIFSPIFHGVYYYYSPWLFSGTFTEEQIDQLVSGDFILIDDEGWRTDPRVIELLGKENDDIIEFEGWFEADLS